MNIGAVIVIFVVSLLIAAYGLFRLLTHPQGDGVQYSTDRYSVYQIRDRVLRREARRKQDAVASRQANIEAGAKESGVAFDDGPTGYIPRVGVVIHSSQPGYRAPVEPSFLDSPTQPEIPLVEPPTTPSSTTQAARMAIDSYDAERHSVSDDAEDEEMREPSVVRPYVRELIPEQATGSRELGESRSELQSA